MSEDIILKERCENVSRVFSWEDIPLSRLAELVADYRKTYGDDATFCVSGESADVEITFKTPETDSERAYRLGSADRVANTEAARAQAWAPRGL